MQIGLGIDSTFAYHGRSMWPTLQEGDLLIVEPVGVSQLRRGDCIVFQTKPEAPPAIHRIVKLRPEIWTRGDGRPYLDDEPVPPGRIIGRVSARVRYGTHRGVRGGVLGLLGGKMIYYAGLLDPYKSSRGGQLARFIAGICGLVTRRWRRRESTIVIDSPAGEVTYLVYGTKTVGRWDDDQCAWVFPWPGSLYLWRATPCGGGQEKG